MNVIHGESGYTSLATTHRYLAYIFRAAHRGDADAAGVQRLSSPDGLPDKAGHRARYSHAGTGWGDTPKWRATVSSVSPFLTVYHLKGLKSAGDASARRADSLLAVPLGTLTS